MTIKTDLKDYRSDNTGFDEHAALSGRHVTKPKRYATYQRKWQDFCTQNVKFIKDEKSNSDSIIFPICLYNWAWAKLL